jgi:hypothetical protein
LEMGVLGFIELDIFVLKCVEFFTWFFECILCSFVNKSQMFLNKRIFSVWVTFKKHFWLSGVNRIRGFKIQATLSGQIRNLMRRPGPIKFIRVDFGFMKARVDKIWVESGLLVCYKFAIGVGDSFDSAVDQFQKCLFVKLFDFGFYIQLNRLMKRMVVESHWVYGSLLSAKVCRTPW